MSTSPRRGDLYVCHSSTGATQSDIGSPLSNGAIDRPFNLVPDSEPRLEIVTKDDEILTCNGQDLLKKILLARSCRVQLEIELDLDILEILLRWGFGAQAGTEISLLAGFQLPATTFIWVHDDPAASALRLADMVCDELTLSGEVSGRVRCTVSFRGSTPVSAGSFTVPECADSEPIRLSDGGFTLDGADRIDDLFSIEYKLTNGLLFDQDAHTAGSVEITRMERNTRRQHSFNFTIYGTEGDALHLQSIDFAEMDIAWQIGDPGINVYATNATIQQNEGPTHVGEAPRSALGLTALPLKVSGDPLSPVAAEVLS